jgi:6-phosphofructokinase 1
VATLAGLSVGASAVYIPEEGISLEMLNSDVKHLKEVFNKDKGQSRAGRLILVNEKASKVYDAKLIASIIRDEAHDRFESRESIPGHVQQGGVPSAMDRCRAVRLAIKCIQHLEDYGRGAHNRVKKDDGSATVIGIQGSEVVFTPVKALEEQATDWPNRRPKMAHWIGMREVVDILGGRPEYPKPEKSLTGLIAKDTKRGLT